MKGKSRAGIAAAFQISMQTLLDWERDFPEFREALARAHVCAQDFLETHGMRNLKSKHYQSQVWKTSMAARFQEYRDAEKGNQSNGLDLGALVAAIGQGVAAATLNHQPGDQAKVINGQPVEDDAAPAPQDVERSRG